MSFYISNTNKYSFHIVTVLILRYGWPGNIIFLTDYTVKYFCSVQRAWEIVLRMPAWSCLFKQDSFFLARLKVYVHLFEQRETKIFLVYSIVRFPICVEYIFGFIDRKYMTSVCSANKIEILDNI
jgi:hypothetical protein